jgi:hypothetical protein
VTDAYSNLLTDLDAMASAPQGLEMLINHLEATEPELLEQILQVEQERQAQLEALSAHAGGGHVNWGHVGIRTAEVAGMFGIGFLGDHGIRGIFHLIR